MSTFHGTAGKDVVQVEESPHDTFYGLGGGDEFYFSDEIFNDIRYQIYGGDGADLFSGGFSQPRYIEADGGAGDDRIDLHSPWVASEAVGVRGGAGDDTIGASGERVLALGEDGNDLLDVGSGLYGGVADGGAGNDTLRVSNYGSVDGGAGGGLAVRGGAGDDRISPRHAEAYGIDANGGAGRDVLTGSDHPDAELGADLLYGGAGDDRISGRRGDDKLGGDGGVDTLTGGAGEDVFDFNAGGSGVGAGRRDVVTDFAPGQDTLDLLSIDANTGRAGDQAFSFVGTRAFGGAGQVRLAKVDGDTVVQGSTDGDAQPEFEILLANGAAPAAGDFDL